jgi:hypothetical protein
MKKKGSLIFKILVFRLEWDEPGIVEKGYLETGSLNKLQ